MHHGIFVTLPDRKVQMYERDFDRYIKSFDKFKSLCEEWICGSDIKITVENTDGFREYVKRAVELLLLSPAFARERNARCVLETKTIEALEKSAGYIRRTAPRTGHP